MRNIQKINMMILTGAIIDIKKRNVNGAEYRTYILNNDPKKVNPIPFRLGKSLDNDIGVNLKIGDQVVLRGSLYGREYKDNYYMDFIAYECYVDESDDVTLKPINAEKNDDEDLPF